MEFPALTPTSSHFNANFSMQMMNQLWLKEAAKESNLVISPLSLHSMLSLVAVGATGSTSDQMLLFLGSDSVDNLKTSSSQNIALASSSSSNEDDNAPSRSPILSFINSLWIDQRFPLKPSFIAIAQNIFRAEARELEFQTKVDQAEDEINSWVKTATKGLVENLIPSGSLNRDTVLVLANALYFKGTWNRKFDATRTQYRDFYLLNGETVQVPFMTCKTYEKNLYRYTDDFKILKIPYQNNADTRQFAMYFFLPNHISGLQNLILKTSLDKEYLNQKFELQEEMLYQFWIPRFKFSYGIEASEILKEGGLILPFTSIGELTEIVDGTLSEQICISQIYHKCYIEVNEEGTEAAASTAPKIILCSGRSNPPTFIADHPFMFMIREETSRTVFFVGTVVNPLLVG